MGTMGGIRFGLCFSTKLAVFSRVEEGHQMAAYMVVSSKLLLGWWDEEDGTDKTKTSIDPHTFHCTCKGRDPSSK